MAGIVKSFHQAINLAETDTPLGKQFAFLIIDTVVQGELNVYTAKLITNLNAKITLEWLILGGYN